MLLITLHLQSRQVIWWMLRLLIGDWGQLPPVMDSPLYTTISRTELSDLGSVNYHLFDRAITLDLVMRQAGNDSAQQLFRNILMRLRNGELRVEDWKYLIQQTPVEVDDDTSGFDEAVSRFRIQRHQTAFK